MCDRPLLLGLGENLASARHQLSVGLDDSAESLGTRHFFDDVMSPDILVAGTIKEPCHLGEAADVDVAATATVITTSEVGELGGNAKRSSKTSKLVIVSAKVFETWTF